jgi:hypothetical protein
MLTGARRNFNRSNEFRVLGRYRQRLQFTDADRCRVAALGHRLGRRVLRQIATVVRPDTILRWHRECIARRGPIAKFPLLANSAHTSPVEIALPPSTVAYLRADDPRHRCRLLPERVEAHSRRRARSSTSSIRSVIPSTSSGARPSIWIGRNCFHEGPYDRSA